MNKKTLILTVVFTLFLSSIAGAEINQNAGTLGSQFLEFGVGARAIGMGEVFVGIADDISALYWNPGALCRLPGKQLTVSHMMMYQGINYEFGAFGMPIGDNMAVAFGASGVIINDLEARTADTDNPDDLFGAMDVAGLGAFSMKLGPLGVGASVKYLYQSIGSGQTDVGRDGDYLGTGLAVDLGVHYASDSIENGKGILAGVSIQNLGQGIVYNGPDGFTGVTNALPLIIKAGFGYKDIENNITIGADINIPSDNDINLHFGGEYLVSKMFAVRLGFKTTTINDLDFLSGFSAGAGFNFEKILVDYAWVPYGPLGLFTHRFSVTAKF